MGGSALFIYGKVEERLLKPIPAPRSIIDRMLRRATDPTLGVWSEMGPNRRVMSLPSHGLRTLTVDFAADVANRFATRWTSTSAVLDYIGVDVMSLHLRGDQEGNQPADWYVQLYFSGCAGLAEIGATLATHWAEKWYRENQERLTSTLFLPNGFEPDGRVDGMESCLFAPVGTAGYAALRPEPSEEADEHDLAESRYFDLDAAPLEGLDESERSDAMRTLDEELYHLLPAGRCCCQWCAPELDIATLDRVVPFKG